MRILFWHLSDLHIKDKKSNNRFQIKKAVDSLLVLDRPDKMILILSGDVAFSGEKAQYTHAYSILISIFRELRKTQFYTGHVDVLCVPGNHDILHGKDPLTVQELQSIHKNYSYNTEIESELNKQRSFFEFAQKCECFESDQIQQEIPAHEANILILTRL